jgi:hypothetical protein
MPYCTYSHVRAICETDITNAEITELIEETDVMMDSKLDTGSLSTPMLRAISRTWTAIRCMTKDPTAMSLGELRYDQQYTLEKLNKMLDELIRIADGGISFSYGYEALPRSYIAT